MLQLNLLAQALGVASLLLVACYPLAKRVTWWPQAMLGLTFGWGAPMGAAAARGTLEWRDLLLYGAAIAWISPTTAPIRSGATAPARISARTTLPW